MQSEGLFFMQSVVKWVGPEGMAFMAETGSGHAVVMDGAPEGGGRNLGPRPMEMVLLGTGGCTAYDVVLILKNSGQPISGCEVRLEAERAEKDPKVFTKIHLHFIVRGKGLRAQLVDHAIKRSHEKYCSATAMLQSTAAITHDFEIIEE
jgi:putative redox protein